MHRLSGEMIPLPEFSICTDDAKPQICLSAKFESESFGLGDCIDGGGPLCAVHADVVLAGTSGGKSCQGLLGGCLKSHVLPSDSAV